MNKKVCRTVNRIDCTMMSRVAGVARQRRLPRLPRLSVVLVIFTLTLALQGLSATGMAQEFHRQSISHSSDYAPPVNPSVNPPNLEDLEVYLKHLQALDAELASLIPAPIPSPTVVPSAKPKPVENVLVDPEPVVPLMDKLPTLPVSLPVVTSPEVPLESRQTAPVGLPPSALPSIPMVVPDRLVLNIKGTGREVMRQVPDETGITTGYLEARCYPMDVFDTQSGSQAGVVEQCHSEIATGAATPSLSGKQMIETTIFHLNEGRLVVQELSTVQPLNWADGEAQSDQFTHITASRSSNSAMLQSDDEAFSSTGLFELFDVKLKSSGMLNLSRALEGEVSMDSIVVLDFF